MNTTNTATAEQLVRIATQKLGEGAPVAAVVDLLLKERVITYRRMRRAVVRHEFFRRLADPATQRTACDIEQDLAAEFGVSVRSVQMFRSERHRR